MNRKFIKPNPDFGEYNYNKDKLVSYSLSLVHDVGMKYINENENLDMEDLFAV